MDIRRGHARPTGPDDPSMIARYDLESPAKLFDVLDHPGNARTGAPDTPHDCSTDAPGIAFERSDVDDLARVA